MRVLISTLTTLALALVLFSGAEARDKDEKVVTLKGKITCAKCDLGVEKKCMTVIVAKQDGKDVTFYFDAKGNKDHHKAICTEAKQGTVTGVVSDDKNDKDKKIITIKTVKFE